MLKNKKLFLFDIDGVIRLGDTIIDGSLQLFNHIKEIGGKSIFITNNATKTNAEYAAFFKKLGFDVDASNFITALSISVAYLKKHHANDLIFACASKSFVDELKKQGLNVTTDFDENVKVLIMGYDLKLNIDKIITVCKILQTKKVPYLATNEDVKWPVTFGFLPDCGAFTELLEKVTGKKPKFLGKPAPEMVLQAIKSTKFSKAQTLVVGDRLYTDIACGKNAGVDTCVVFTGEVKEKDLKTSELVPTYKFKSVKQLYEALKKN